MNRNESLAHRDAVMGVIFLLVLVALGLGALGLVLLAVVFLIRLSRGKSGIKSGLPPYSPHDDGSWTQPAAFGPAFDASVPPPIPSASEDPAEPRRHHGHDGMPASAPIPESCPASDSPSNSSCGSDFGCSDSGGGTSSPSGSSE